jgi:uncharacterized protein with von Willebrand factor type A (vWA) domain
VSPTETVAKVDIDLPGLATAFSQRLHEADMPVSPAQSEQYVRSLALTRPSSQSRLYFTTRAIFVTDAEQMTTFDRVFTEVFGAVAEDDPVAAVAAVELEPALSAAQG